MNRPVGRGLSLLLFLALVLPMPAAAITVTTKTLQNAAAANGNGTVVNVTGMTTVVIEVEGTFSATVSFQANVNTNGSQWTALECFSLSNRTTAATSATSTGAWRCNLIGVNRIRTPVSGYASGSVTVTAGIASAGVM